jgi:hypothetical protein
MTQRHHFDEEIEAAGARIGSPELGVMAEAFCEHSEECARRLAACWNVCKGIDTVTLEELGAGALLRIQGGQGGTNQATKT